MQKSTVCWLKLLLFSEVFRNDTAATESKYFAVGVSRQTCRTAPRGRDRRELLQQIQDEKQRLNKAGNAKKEKLLPEITDEDIPFDTPNTWCWVHLNQIAVSNLGKTLDKVKNTGELCPYLCSINVYWSGIDLSKVKEARFEEAEREKYLLQQGDLLVCEGGDCGRAAIWESEQTMYYQNALHRIRFYGNVDPHFYRYLLEYYKIAGIIERYSKGETIKHLVQNALYAMWMPLPPLAEQKRIIAKIEEILPFIERYDAVWRKLETTNERFPVDMRQAILWAAIQGKLTKQIDSESAECILSELSLSELAEDECYFDIPDNWKWCKIKDIFTLVNGKAFKPTDWSQAGLPIVRIQNLNDFNAPFNYYAGTIEDKYILNGGELLFSWSGTPGTSFGAFIWTGGKAVLNQHIFIVYPRFQLDIKYAMYALNGELKIFIDKAHGGAGLKHITKKEFENCGFPIPPLEEQKRIVAKLEEILPLCEQLK